MDCHDLLEYLVMLALFAFSACSAILWWSLWKAEKQARTLFIKRYRKGPFDHD